MELSNAFILFTMEAAFARTHRYLYVLVCVSPGRLRVPLKSEPTKRGKEIRSRAARNTQLLSRICLLQVSPST